MSRERAEINRLRAALDDVAGALDLAPSPAAWGEVDVMILADRARHAAAERDAAIASLCEVAGLLVERRLDLAGAMHDGPGEDLSWQTLIGHVRSMRCGIHALQTRLMGRDR